MSENPFEGIRVVEVTQFLAGSEAGCFLADWGADVIHVEHPERGDGLRYSFGGFNPGPGAKPSGAASAGNDPAAINFVWESTNRNKRAITLDLSKPQGRQIIHRLATDADVFLTSFTLPDVRKYCIDYHSLSGDNPRLIYGAITAYGQKGPEKDLAGYEGSSYLARSGFLHMLAGPGKAPPHLPLGFGDLTTGMALALGITVALFARQKSGVGQEVDVSLYGSAVFALSWPLGSALATRQEQRLASRQEAANPLQNVYETKDGRWLRLVGSQPTKHWPRFCAALELSSLIADPRFATFEAMIQNHVALISILDKLFVTKTLAEWKTVLDGVLPWSPCMSLLEVIDDPQARENDFFVPLDHPVYGRIETVANPIKLSKTPARVRTPGPLHGQHTEDVLLEAGYDWDDILRFRDEGVIA